MIVHVVLVMLGHSFWRFTTLSRGSFSSIEMVSIIISRYSRICSGDKMDFSQLMMKPRSSRTSEASFNVAYGLDAKINTNQYLLSFLPEVSYYWPEELREYVHCMGLGPIQRGGSHTDTCICCSST